DAVFVHQETATTSATPTRFYKSRMTWNGKGWDLVLQDGTTYVFGENAPLQAIRDRYGNQVTVTWSFVSPVDERGTSSRRRQRATSPGAPRRAAGGRRHWSDSDLCRIPLDDHRRIRTVASGVLHVVRTPGTWVTRSLMSWSHDFQRR